MGFDSRSVAAGRAPPGFTPRYAVATPILRGARRSIAAPLEFDHPILLSFRPRRHRIISPMRVREA
ncbi:MAG: hypothetical protein CMJ18_02015 [Phycisphaeraceae bacterium]|nr:hypothetical protein [Phycisphaeraceae bacterium]